MTHLKTWTAAILTALVGIAAYAETDLETAITNGGDVLTADQIANLIVGKVVTAQSGEKTFRFYYDPSNTLDGELTNGGWSGTGAFAITDSDQVCVSMAADKGRYRCLTAVRTGDMIQKFNAAGKMTFELLGFKNATGL